MVVAGETFCLAADVGLSEEELIKAGIHDYTREVLEER